MIIDIIFAVLMLFACIKGLRKGLIIGIFSIVAFIVGMAAALKLSAVVANRLSESINVSAKWLPVLSFILVFIVVVLLVNLGARLIQKSFEIAMLGWVNRIGGLILFVFLYSIIYSIFLFYAVELKLLKPETTEASKIFPYIFPLALKVMQVVGTIVPIFKDIFSQLEQFFDGVSNNLQH